MPDENAPPSQTGGTPPQFRRLLGPWSGLLTVLAIVIGAGIYSVPQQVAQYSSSGAMVLGLWFGMGLFCIAASLVWGELGARLPVAGNNYVAIRTSYGRHIGFLYGWKSLALSNPSNRAGLAIVAAEYLAAVIPSLGDHRSAVGIGILTALATLNACGLRHATVFHSTISVVKVAALLLFVGFALSVGSRAGLPGLSQGLLTHSPATTTDLPAYGRIALACILIFFSYTGWARVSAVAEEFRRPESDLAKAFVRAMGLVVVIYLLVLLSYFSILGLDGVRESSAVGADAMALLLGPYGAMAFALLVVISVLGSMSTSIMSAGRLYYSMAHRGDFFKFFDFLHPRSRVPTRAIFIHLVLSCLMLIVKGNFVDLVTSAIFVNMIFFALRVHSLFILRRKGVGAPDGFRTPFYSWLPAVVLAGFVVMLTIRVIVDWDRAWFDIALLSLGLPCSWIWHRLRGTDDDSKEATSGSSS